MGYELLSHGEAYGLASKGRELGATRKQTAKGHAFLWALKLNHFCGIGAERACELAIWKYQQVYPDLQPLKGSSFKKEFGQKKSERESYIEGWQVVRPEGWAEGEIAAFLAEFEDCPEHMKGERR